MDLLASVGKSPAHIQKDVPGFVANRLQHTLWREAISMPELNSLPGPNPYLESKVAAGQLGFKTGVGFRTWSTKAIRTLREQPADSLLKARRERIGT